MGITDSLQVNRFVRRKLCDDLGSPGRTPRAVLREFIMQELPSNVRRTRKLLGDMTETRRLEAVRSVKVASQATPCSASVDHLHFLSASLSLPCVTLSRARTCAFPSAPVASLWTRK